MSQQVIVTTERMELVPISIEELQEKIAQTKAPEMKQAYTEMLDGCIQHPDQHLWHTVWNMKRKDGTGTVVGDLCFKGLGEDGMVEIGYGMEPGFMGRGLATEAVTALISWAAAQPGVITIEAETDPDNAASQRVLQKAGFVPNGVTGEEGPRFIWKQPINPKASSNPLPVC